MSNLKQWRDLAIAPAQIRRTAPLGLATLAIILLSSTAHAQSTWVNTGQADWAVGSNWDPVGVPDAATDVVIDNGGEAQITAVGAAASVVTLGSTTGTTGTLTITQSAVGGTLASTSATIGQAGTGILNVSRLGSSWTNTGNVIIGDEAGGSGTLSVTMAATIATNTDAGTSTIIGNASGSTGSASVDGAGSIWASGGTIVVGNGGGGGLSVSSGGVVTDTDAVIGALSGGSGTAMVTGEGSSWSHAGSLVIGDAGTGGLTIEASGTVTNDSAVIGASEGGSGTVLVTEGGSLWATTNALTVGDAGSGGLTIEAGGVVTDASATIGNAATGSGTVLVTGEGSIWSTTGALAIGNAGTGGLTVEAGATASNDSATLGVAEGSVGSALVTGEGSTWTTTTDLVIGDAGDGSLTIEAGGTAIAADATIADAETGTGSALVTGTGSTWTTTGALTVGNAGTGSLTVALGGAVTAASATFGAEATGSGSADVSGEGSSLAVDGTLTLGADGNGDLAIAGSGSVTAADVMIGDNATGTGSAGISGEGSSLAVDGAITVGGAGSGQLAIAAAGTVTSSGSSIGAESGSTGAVTVDGDGSSWTDTGELVIGALGNGELAITAGGSVVAASATIGSGATGVGITSVNGQGSNLAVTGDLTVGAEGDGTLSLTNEGVVTVGDGAGIVTLAASAGSTGTLLIGDSAGAGILNAAEVTGGDGTAAIVFNHNEGAYAFDALISGSTSLYQIGSGTTVLNAANTYEGVTSVEAGTLRAGIANAISPNSAVSVANGAILDLDGFDQTLMSLTNDGTVSVFGTIAGATLTVAGDYAGTGTLVLGAALAGDDSTTDKLAVTGNVSGTTFVQIVNLGGTGAQTTGSGIQVITVNGDSPSDAFSSGRTIAGAWDYRLYQGGVGADAGDGNWYLRSDLSYAAQTYRAYPATLLAFGQQSVGTLRQRTGGWVTGTPVTNLPGGAWVRAKGSWGDVNPESGSPYSQNIAFGQTGAEFELPVSLSGSLSAGVMATFGRSSTTVTVTSHGESGTGTIDSTAYGIGGNLTWRGNAGFYADAVLQGTFYDTDIGSSEIGNLASGVSATGTAASLEVGQAFAVGHGITITPEAQLVYTSVNFDSFADRDATVVSGGSADSLIGRAGVRVEHAGFVSNAATDATRFNAYILANIAYNFMSGTEVLIEDTLLAQEQAALAGEIGVGAAISFGRGWNIYGEGSYATTSLSSGDDNLWSGNFGVRVQW